jgi:hypothetical protein
MVKCNISLKKFGSEVAIPWASRGPVLTPLIFIVWGNVKTRILAHLKEKSKRLLRYAAACVETSGEICNSMGT